MPAGACTSSCVRHKQQQPDPRDADAILATLHELPVLCLPAALFQSRQRMHAKQNFPILTETYARLCLCYVPHCHKDWPLSGLKKLHVNFFPGLLFHRQTKKLSTQSPATVPTLSIAEPPRHCGCRWKFAPSRPHTLLPPSPRPHHLAAALAFLLR